MCKFDPFIRMQHPNSSASVKQYMYDKTLTAAYPGYLYAFVANHRNIQNVGYHPPHKNMLLSTWECKFSGTDLIRT